jgi:hypothetical protein
MIGSKKRNLDAGVACYKFDSQMGFWGIPNIDLDLNFGSVTHDEYGNRNSKHESYMEDKKILCFGGSHTWGGGIPQGLRYTDLLQKSIKQQVINVGHCSLGLDQICLAILSKSKKYNPEVIIIEQHPWAVHRILNNYVNGYVKPYFYLDNKKKLKLKKVPWIARYKFFRTLIGQYYSFRKELKEFEKDINIKYEYDPELDPIFLLWKARQYDGMYDLLEQILLVISEFCRKNDIKLLFAVGVIRQQFCYQSQSKLIDYELPRKRLINLLEKIKIDYVDLTPSMLLEHTTENPVIFEDGHINLKGHQIFSEVLLSNMKDRD